MMEAVAVAENKAVYQPFGKRVTTIFRGRPEDWYLGEERGQREKVFERWGTDLRNNRVREVFCPKIQAGSTLVTGPNSRQGVTDGIKFYVTKPTEAMCLWPGQAMMFSTADCPTLLLYDRVNKLLVAGHAGRDSLIDRTYITTGQRSAKNREPSIVNAMAKYLSINDRESLRAFGFGGIGPDHFIHPIDSGDKTYQQANHLLQAFVIKNYGQDCLNGQRNEKIGRLNLHKIIRSQLEKYGLRYRHDGIDTAGDCDAHGQPQRWSHRRDGARPKRGSNGVLVINCG